MKTRAVFEVVWLTQLLTACALRDGLLTTHGLEVPSSPTLATETTATNQELGTTTITAAHGVTSQEAVASTVPPPAEEFSTKWTPTVHPSVTRLDTSETEVQTSSQNVEHVSKFDHKIKSLGQTVSSNSASLGEENKAETGTWSGAFTTRLDTNGPTRHDREATASEMEAHSTTVPHAISRNLPEVTQTVKRGSTAGQGPHTTAVYATQLDNQTSLSNTRAAHDLDTEVTARYYNKPKAVNVTQVTYSIGQTRSTQGTEGPLVTSTGSPASPAVSDGQWTEKWMENVTTKESHMSDVKDTTWTDSVSTQYTESSYNFTTELQGHTTASHQTSPGNSTVGYLNLVPPAELSQDTTGRYITTEVMSSDSKDMSMQTTDRPAVFSTSTSRVSEASQSSGTEHSPEWTENVTTGRYTTRLGTEATHTASDSIWTSPVSDSTEAATTGNTSGQTEWATWPDCFDKVSPTQRSSKLACLITLWILAMTASIFLGLTVFLWVRLSVVKKRAKRRTWRDRGGKLAEGKELKSLWATDGTSTEERVEFWYASGSTLEADKKGRQRGRLERTKRKRGKQKEGKDGDMWIQPKVTLQDISEFWYANGRGTDEERTERRCETNGLNTRDRETMC